ncbi:MAG: substrate-binding domain-containing protein [Alphaproteobacteria bacterium]|nr:substrate-binding domain-containing protein [Alphaproteobacteria bacterium]
MKIFITILFAVVLSVSPLAFVVHAKNKQLLLATTTSVHNSGLLDILLQAFEKNHDITVKAVIQGSGLAIRSAIDGNADVIMTHAPEAEQQLVASGYGVKRYPFMYNQFVIVGPQNDRLQGKLNLDATDVLASLQQIATKRVPFVSRGDDSGTHQKELALWQKLGIVPDNDKNIFSWNFLSRQSSWYIQSGTGMGQSLLIAFEKNAYILSDEATWLRFKSKMGDFKIHVKGDELLFNQYSVIAANPEKHPYLQYQSAKKFIDFLIGAQGQKIIARYKINGKTVFFANAQ